jgi:hypothetical protein
MRGWQRFLDQWKEKGMSNEEVIRDVVVVLPGIMGSTLAKNGKMVWAPSAGSVLKAIARGRWIGASSERDMPPAAFSRPRRL